MPGSLNYTQYYQKQMSFLVNHIENQSLNVAEQARAQRIKNNLARQYVHFTDDFLTIAPGDELLATRIGYIPPGGSRITLLAPDKDRANAYRHLTRQRLVYGPVDFYLGSQFDTPTEIPIITTCAINLMGTSPHDSARFNPNGVFNAVEYQKECDKLADFIVSSAVQHGHERLVMPAFGVGLYIQTLDPESQIKARELMYKAFAQAAQRQQLRIDWIVWAKDTKNDPTQIQRQLSALGNQYIKPIIHADFLQYGQELLAKNVNAVLLNAGSDRTVGGKYTTNKGSMDKLPVEEQMTQQSDLAILHTEYNKIMADNFKRQVTARRIQIPQPKPEVAPATALYTPFHGGKDSALAIRNYLGVKELPWIYSNGSNYKISFKNKTNAQILVNKGYGLNLKVTPEGSYYGVILKANQYTSLMQNIKQPIVPHQKPSEIADDARPSSTNELMIAAIKQAVKKYQEWHRGEAEHRGPNGFFSWLRHGSTGQRRATTLVEQITEKGVDIEGIVNNLLKNPSTAYHRHSLSSFLLDELGHIEGSTWYGLAPNAKLLYEQHKVVDHLERTSQGIPSRR